MEEETVHELKNFVKECNDLFITSETTINPKIVGNYTLNHQDVSAQVIDWVFHYLENRKCPYNLAVAIAKETAQKINASISEQQLEENSEQGNLLNSLKLYNDTIRKLASVCKSYVEEVNENDNYIFTPQYTASVFAIKNKRRKMEDRHVIHHDLNMLLDLKDMPHHSYYAVFDGHSGVDAASYASAHLHINIARHPSFLTDTVTAISDAYKITDENFSKKCCDENLRSGSTAVSALFREKTIYLSWLGDSQAVLVKEGKPVIITSPHKPEREDERKRIEGLGGSISFVGTWRVNGMLAVTRAIGDADYKPYVSNEPEVDVFHLDGTEDFLILACDGLWDGMSPEDVISALYYNLLNSAVDEPLDTVAAKLVHQSKLQGSEDNITAVVIFLRDPKDIKENAEKYIPNLSNLRMNFLSLNGEEKMNSDFSSNISINKPNILELNNSSTTKLQNTVNVLNAAGLGDPSLTCSFFNQAEGHSYKEHNIYSEKQSSLMHFAPETTALSELPTPPIDDVLASEQFEEMCSTNLTKELHSISAKEFTPDTNTKPPPSDTITDSTVEQNIFHSQEKNNEELDSSEAVNIASSVVSNAIETAVKCLSSTELNEANHVSTTKLNPYAEPFVMKSFTPDNVTTENVSSHPESALPDILNTSLEKDLKESSFKEKETLVNDDKFADSLIFQQNITEINLNKSESVASSSELKSNDQVNNSVNLNDPTEEFDTLEADNKGECLNTLEKVISSFNEQDIIDNLSALNLNTSNRESIEKNKSACFTSEEIEDLNLYNSMLDTKNPNPSNSNFKIENLNLDNSEDLLNAPLKTSSFNLDSNKNSDPTHSEVFSIETVTNTCPLNQEKAEISYDTNINTCFEAETEKVESSSLIVETSAASETQFLSNLHKGENSTDFVISNSASINNSVTECLFNSDKNFNQFSTLENYIETSTSDIEKVTSSLLVESSFLEKDKDEISPNSDILLNLINQPSTESSCEIKVKDSAVSSEKIVDDNIKLENLALSNIEDKLSTAAVLPSEQIEECHVDEVAVDLQTIPVGVPEAEGVTEDIDSDSEKDGGWSYMKVGGVKQKQTSSTSVPGKSTAAKSDSSKTKKEISKTTFDAKNKIRNIASFDKSKKVLPEKKGLDVKAKSVKSVPITTTKLASDKSSKVTTVTGVKKETLTTKSSTLTANKPLKTSSIAAPRNISAQVKSTNLPSTSRSQIGTKTLSTVKPKPTTLFKSNSNFTTSTPLSKKPPSYQSTKSNLASVTMRTTLNRPVANTVPTRALSSTKPLQKPASTEAKPKPTSATIKRTIPSTVKNSDVKETKEQANKQISDKKNTIPKASSRGLTASSVTNTLKSTLPVGNKPITKMRNIPPKNEFAKKDVPKTQSSHSAAKNTAPSKLIKKTATVKNNLPSENKAKEKNRLNVEKDIKSVEMAALSEEEKLLHKVIDKEIPVKELNEIAATTSEVQAPVENGCTAENDSEEEKLLHKVIDKEIPVKELNEIAATTSEVQAPVENGCTAENDVKNLEEVAIPKPTESLL